MFMKYRLSICLVILLLTNPLFAMETKTNESAKAGTIAILAGVAFTGFCTYKLYNYLTTTDENLIKKSNQLCADIDKKYKHYDFAIASYLGNDWKKETSFPRRKLEAMHDDLTKSMSYTSLFRFKTQLIKDFNILQKEKDAIAKRLASCKQERKIELEQTLTALNERITLDASIFTIVAISYETESKKVGSFQQVFTELLG